MVEKFAKIQLIPVKATWLHRREFLLKGGKKNNGVCLTSYSAEEGQETAQRFSIGLQTQKLPLPYTNDVCKYRAAWGNEKELLVLPGKGFWLQIISVFMLQKNPTDELDNEIAVNIYN